MKERDHYFDNARFLLIFLVVLGHTIAPFTNKNHFIHTLYTWIYFFHMPAFILISGYFAKNYKKKGHYKKIALKLLLPYFSFELLYYFFNRWVIGDHINLDLLSPFWLMWFLISLFCWHLLLWVFDKMPYPILFSIILSAAAGYIEILDKELSLMRTFVLFPFFLLGFYMKREQFRLLKNKKVQYLSFIFLMGLFLYIHKIGGINLEWLWGGNSYKTAGLKGIQIPFLRILYTIFMLFVSFSFLSLISVKKWFITYMGPHTLSIYLLHGFFLRTLLYKINWINNPETISDYLVIFLFVLLMCFISVLKPVRILLKPFLEPYHFFLTLHSFLCYYFFGIKNESEKGE